MGHGVKVFFCFITFLFSFFVHSDEIKPVTDIENIRIIHNSTVEWSFLKYLLKNARKSIWFSTFHIVNDSTGGPILDILTEKANEGVEVKLLTSYYAAWNGDPFNSVNRRLSQIDSPSFDYLLFGSGLPGPYSKNGWFYSDSTHCKLIIIDGSLIFISGRGQTDYYKNWYDLATVIKGREAAEVGIQIFQKLYPELKRANEGIDMNSDLYAIQGQAQPWVPIVNEEGNISSELAQLKLWASKPETMGSPENAFTLTGLSNQFIQQMSAQAKSPSHISYPERVEMAEKGELQDPILDSIIDSIQNARKSIKIMSFALNFLPKTFSALQAAMERGVRVQLMVNSKTAVSYAFGTRFAPAVGYYQGIIPHALEILKNPMGEILLFEPTDLKYSHAKFIVIDDETVYLGSHNLTFVSSISVEEMQLKLTGSKMGEYANTIWEHAKENYAPHVLTVDEFIKESQGKFTRFMYSITSFLDYLF